METMKKWLHRVLLILLVLVGSLLAGVHVYVQHPKFGTLPDGDRLEIIKVSPNYAHGEFQNLIATPILTDDTSFISALFSNLFAEKERPTPNAPIPSLKTDLKTLERDKDTVIWFGHSSVLRSACRQTDSD